MSERSKTEWLFRRPEVSEQDASRFVAEVYGFEGTATEIGSQQDRNFLVEGEIERVLLKIYNENTPRDVIALQDEAMRLITQAGLLTPSVHRSKSGEETVRMETAADRYSYARAYEYLDGDALATTDPPSGVTAERLGELAGATVRALESAQHPAADREIQWDLQRASKVIDTLLHHLPEDRQSICEGAAAQAQKIIDGVSASLPMQIIHGDVTRDNVIRDSLRRLWLIDLGDVSRSWRVAELAITAADLYGSTGDMAKVARAVTGFAKHVKLTDDELQVIWPLMVLRGAVLAVSGWSQLAIDPDNDYARERLDHEWRVFTETVAVDTEEATATIRLAANVPHREQLQYTPIVSDFASHEIIDLSVTSPLLDRGAWLEPNIEKSIVEAADAPVVVARFGEARLTRTSPNVLRPAATRTHGIEMWLSAGTPLLAPFSGHLTVGKNVVRLRDAGVTLTITGVEKSASEGKVSAGDILAFSHGESVYLTRQFGNAPPAEPFGSFDSEFISVGALDPSPLLGLKPAVDVDLVQTHEQIRRDLAMGEASERYYSDPPQIERGWQSLMIDTRGRAYLDMVNNVTAIGHSNVELADRVSRQLNLLNTNSRFLYSAYADFTEALLAHSPHPSLDTVIPVNSGSEALDLAIRLAQIATGRSTIVAAREGYHGWTMASDAVTTSAFDNPHALDSRPDWVELVDAPNGYRGVHQGPDAGERYAEDARTHFRHLVNRGAAPAAFLSEPVLGNAGGVIPPEGYLEQVYKAIREVGGLAIADEVQVGYGRLGKTFWASEMLGAVPDIIATAKAAGNAYPVGAIITRRELVETLRYEGKFFSSAGGAPASAVAATVVLDEIRERGLQQHALNVGASMIAKIEGLAVKHDIIGAVHGSGLYVGVELVRDRTTKEPAREETALLCDLLLERGIIMQATSERQNVLKVKPPMVITDEEVDMFICALDDALAALPHYAPRASKPGESGENGL